MTEQRKSQRFKLRLPLRILRVGGNTLSGGGETVNVGSHGVLFSAERRLEIGESIEYTITFPSAPGSSEGTGLHCLGKVLRYEGSVPDPDRQAKLYLMVATIERHEFVRE